MTIDCSRCVKEFPTIMVGGGGDGQGELFLDGENFHGPP